MPHEANCPFSPCLLLNTRSQLSFPREGDRIVHIMIQQRLKSDKAERYGNGWRYSVIPHKNSDELLHYHQEQTQQLPPEELRVQIQTEIDEH
jgi:hypothetical protein